MSLTLLQIVQAATGEMGLAVPTYVAGNNTTDVIQLQYLINSSGRDLAREFDWQALNQEYRFTTQFFTVSATMTAGSPILTSTSTPVGYTVDSKWMITGTGIPQDTYILTTGSGTATMSQNATATGTYTLTVGQTKYPLPSDWDRQIDRTHYDKSKRWEMQGPETPQQWEFLKSSYISTGPRIRYKIAGGYFQVWPLVAANEYLGFDYISNAWARSASGTTQTTLVADTDYTIFPDDLMILALKRKYFEIKGFAPDAIERDYTRSLNIAKANDAGSPTLSFAPRPSSVLVGYENIPDSGYGA